MSHSLLSIISGEPHWSECKACSLSALSREACSRKESYTLTEGIAGKFSRAKQKWFCLKQFNEDKQNKVSSGWGDINSSQLATSRRSWAGELYWADIRGPESFKFPWRLGSRLKGVDLKLSHLWGEVERRVVCVCPSWLVWPMQWSSPLYVWPSPGSQPTVPLGSASWLPLSLSFACPEQSHGRHNLRLAILVSKGAWATVLLRCP